MAQRLRSSNRAAQKISAANPYGNGQQYASHIKGGIVLDSGKTLYTDVFGHSVNEPTTDIKLITNMPTAGRMGASELFVVQQYSFRLWKNVEGSAVSDAEAADMIRFMEASRVRFFIGDNATKVLDIELAHFMSPISMARGVAGDNSLTINTQAFMNLKDPKVQQIMAKNMTFKAEWEVEHSAGTPANLDGFIANMILGGIRTVQ